MSDTKPFRFLDLPKEIRLMVYERLPTKISHHSTAFREIVSPLHPVLICSTISGINILATCLQIHNEAGAVLGPRLASIEKSPVRLIVVPYALDNGCSAAILRSLFASKLDCSYLGDPVLITALRNAWLKVHKQAKDVTPHSQIQRVDIALKFIDNSEFDFRPTLEDLEFSFACFCNDNRGITKYGYESSVSIRVRPAVLPQYAKAILEREQPIRSSPFIFNHAPDLAHGTLRIEGGEYVEEEEWQRDWAEGERFE